MRNIKVFDAPKYSNKSYKKVADGIYFSDGSYYMSISFEQESEFDEGADASDISQYPLEDLLDKYSVYVSDFYNSINLEGHSTCYIEISSDSQNLLEEMKSIVGKHIYNKVCVKDGEEVIDLIIE